MATKKAAKKTTKRQSPTAKKAVRKTAKKTAAATRSAAKTKKTARRTAPTTRTSRSRTDGLTMLIDDHKEVEAMFKRYEKLGDSATKAKATLIEKITRELSIHATIEEQVLYPTVEKETRGGKGLVHHAEDEHQDMKILLADLQKLDTDDVRTDALMTKLISVVRDHVKEEEKDMFPKMRKELARESLEKMGELMQMAKKTAPTRPHPNIPNGGPATVIAGMGMGAVDRVRDAVSEAMN